MLFPSGDKSVIHTLTITPGSVMFSSNHYLYNPPPESPTSEYSFINQPPPDFRLPPPPPTNTPTPPSPKTQTFPPCIMQLENILEFSGTHKDKTQLLDFLKAIKRSFLANGTTADDQKTGLFSNCT